MNPRQSANWDECQGFGNLYMSRATFRGGLPAPRPTVIVYEAIYGQLQMTLTMPSS